MVTRKIKHLIPSLAVFCPLLLSATLGAQDAQDDRAKPDILFIAIDDMNDWVSVLGGHPQTRTPNIEALARRGMLFTNAHAVGAACMPSRTALLTGVSPFNSGVYRQVGDWRNNPNLEGLATLPRHFRDNEYLTLGAGKLFHAHTYRLDGFEGQQDYSAWDAYYPSLIRQLPDEVQPAPGQTEGPALGRGRATGSFDYFPTVTEDYAMGDGQVVNWISQQLLAAAPGPRFISAGIFRPHLPWYVPQKYFDMYPVDDIILPQVPADDMDDIPDSALNVPEIAMNTEETNSWLAEEPQRQREAIQGYLASMSFADEMVGRLMDALERSGRLDNTIIVLWGDHGYHLGEKNRWGKQTLWEETTRVPLIVIAPGVTTPGSSSSEAVSLLDIYPTLTELAGLQTPAHVDGESLVPLLRNPGTARDGVAITTYGFGDYTVRSNRYRYIVYSDGQEELYDHETDPNEWHNLAGDSQYAAIKAGLIARLPPAEKRVEPFEQ